MTLSSKLNDDIEKLRFCINLIDDFAQTNNKEFLNKRLFVIKRNLTFFSSELGRMNYTTLYVRI